MTKNVFLNFLENLEFFVEKIVIFWSIWEKVVKMISHIIWDRRIMFGVVLELNSAGYSFIACFWILNDHCA